MSAGNNVRVMIVDDEPVIRQLLTRVVGQADGFEVVGEADGGQAAVEQARRLQPDLVLLDVMMPAMSGDEALPHILTVAPRCMVAVVSALEDPELDVQLRSLGAFCRYSKSSISELPELIRRDHALFRRALEGEDVATPWCLRGVAIA